jgi:predicted Zn-dependent protease
MATHDEIQALRLAIAVDPGSLALRLHLADQLAKAGRPVEALEEYQRVLDGQPDHSEALTGAESAAAALDHTERAASFRARRERPAPKAQPAPPSEEDALQDIRDAVSAGEHPRASERIRELLVEAPHDERLLRWRGYIHLLAGRYDEALREGTDTAARTPSDGWGHWLRGAALLELGRVDEAIAAARDGLRREPSDERLLEQGARALFLAKRYDEARALALRLLRTTPEASTPHRLLAVLAVQGQRWSEAEVRLRRAVEIAPDVELIKAHANALWMSDRAPEAIATLERCVTAYPEDEGARLLLRRYRRLLGSGTWILSATLVLAAPAVAFLYTVERLHPGGRAAVGVGIAAGIVALFTLLRARERSRFEGSPDATPDPAYALRVLGGLVALVAFAVWGALIREAPQRYLPRSLATWALLAILGATAVASVPYLILSLRSRLIR